MFIENIKYFKKTNNESKTIVYFIDEIKALLKESLFFMRQGHSCGGCLQGHFSFSSQ